MPFDFDTLHERRGTDSQKWQKYAGRDILPMWVADMDFTSPPAVVAALQRRAAEGIFGYARPTPSQIEAVVERLDRSYGWKIDPAWLVWLPGLVAGLNNTARAFGGPVVACTPVYPPFLSAPKNAGQESRPVPLILHDGRWEMDWEALERAAAGARLFFFCHPHNPVARVWRRDEVERLVQLCLRHGLILCSDEIHADLALDALPHLPPAALSPEVAARTVTLLAPSKAFNIPGLGCSLAVIPDAALRTTFTRAAAGIMAEVTCLGYAACEAAYREGEPWRQALLAYLRNNRARVLDAVSGELPGIKIEAPIEATYLAWMNVEALALPDPLGFFETAGVGLSDGRPFGTRGSTHVRLNFGCPRATLDEGLARMSRALRAR